MIKQKSKASITIVVEGGMVQSVYSTDENIEVEVIDLDIPQDENEAYDEALQEVKKVQDEQYLVW